MPVRDIRTVSAAERLEADFCIIGSGPAGATIALELAPTKAKILLIESGGVKRESGSDALDEIESVGWPRVMNQWLIRNRMLGGTSNTWGGRCTTFDRIDYENRTWVQHSGWPFQSDELGPFIIRSASHLGLVEDVGPDDRDVEISPEQRRPTPAAYGKPFKPCLWQFSSTDGKASRSVKFSDRLIASKAQNLELILNATATHVNTNEAGSAVESVDIRGSDGELRKVFASRIVLAVGGIENARLLLASNRVHSCGVGNERDLIGRFLMDHLKGVVGNFDPPNAQLVDSWFQPFLVKSRLGNHRMLRGLRLSPEFQRVYTLLNCAAFLDENEFIAADDPWLAMRRMLKGKRPEARDALAVTTNLNFVADGLYRRFVKMRSLPRLLQKLELKCIVEQQPDPQSRVTLSTRVDRFGVPLPRIDWKVNEAEQRTIKTMAKLLKLEFASLQLDLKLEEWVAEDGGLPDHFRDIAHPTGTTRMSADPHTGVVDPHCEVHGVRGLFVAGSSVFPTAGHANPTQMVVALAIRLADELKSRIMSSPSR